MTSIALMVAMALSFSNCLSFRLVTNLTALSVPHKYECICRARHATGKLRGSALNGKKSLCAVGQNHARPSAAMAHVCVDA